MRSIDIDICPPIFFSNFNQIVGHPKNIDLCKKRIVKYSEKTGEYINVNNITMISNAYMDEFTYVRTDILPDNKFVQWIDMSNIPSWAIYFKMVKKARIVYIVNNLRSTVYDPNMLETKAKKMMNILEKYLPADKIKDLT